MKTQHNMKLQMNYFEKDNWVNMMQCWLGINSSYKVFPVQL